MPSTPGLDPQGRRRHGRGGQRDHGLDVPPPEDDIPWIVDNLGGDDTCLVMGSDFPHAEGLAEPVEFEKLLDPLDRAARERIMRGNATVLFDR